MAIQVIMPLNLAPTGSTSTLRAEVILTQVWQGILHRTGMGFTTWGTKRMAVLPGIGTRSYSSGSQTDLHGPTPHNSGGSFFSNAIGCSYGGSVPGGPPSSSLSRWRKNCRPELCGTDRMLVHADRSVNRLNTIHTNPSNTATRFLPCRKAHTRSVQNTLPDLCKDNLRS